MKPEVDGLNSTFVPNVTFCGRFDCPGSDEAKIKKPLISTVYILCGIYVLCALIAAGLILVLLNNYKQIGMSRTKKEFSSPLHLLINTIKHIKQKNQLLIIPLTLWSGFEQAFFSADFTKSFISCVKGVNYVGIILICYGVTDAIGSYLFGYVIKYIGRIPCFIMAAIFNYTSIFIMIFWVPNTDSSYILYIVAVLWGLADAVWLTQINSKCFLKKI